MPLISDETGIYAIRPDGTRDYGSMNYFEIDGKRLYDFNPETGVLQVSMRPGDLEMLMEQIGEIPENGRDLVLPTPFVGPARFKGVKRIESISNLKENEYLMKLQKPSLLERMKRYLK